MKIVLNILILDNISGMPFDSWTLLSSFSYQLHIHVVSGSISDCSCRDKYQINISFVEFIKISFNIYLLLIMMLGPQDLSEGQVVEICFEE